MGWLKRWKLLRQQTVGGVVVLTEGNDNILFFPRSQEGKEIGRRVRREGMYRRRFPGGFAVPWEEYRDVYDKFNNDPDHPQIMVNIVGIGFTVFYDT